MSHPDAPTGRQALWAAYRKSAYHVPGGVVRIGRRSAAVDEILRRFGCREAVLITAWNPRSRPTLPGRNARQQRRLVEALRRYPLLPAKGGAGRWWEDHLLVMMPAAKAAEIARQFCQNAIVKLRRGQPACLNPTYPGDLGV